MAAALAGATVVASPRPALARPEAPRTVCDTYPDAARCRGRFVECTLCHHSVTPTTWNDYGTSLLTNLVGDDFESALGDALIAVEAEDVDEDGVSNAAELLAGTSPSDPDDAWCATPRDAADVSPAPEVDLSLAYRRVSSLFCGQSPSYEQQAEFDAMTDPGARYERLHAQLGECLDGAFWRDVALPRLGDTKITPIHVYGRDSPADVTFADYEWDYRLFAYVLTGDRDARELLLADYHVRRAEDGSLEPVAGTIPADVVRPPPFGMVGGQPLEPEHRAGLLTTQWFLFFNTFLSGLPRTTAAQAYRAFLGYDIARLEGIQPVSDEPADYDARGVDTPECAVCHSTLDPLSYAFMDYEGLVLPTSGAVIGGYNPRRPGRLFPDWDGPTPLLFDQEVPDVLTWARVATESPEFRHMLGEMFFGYAFDREPVASELEPFDACWQRLPELGWSANALIHCIVDIPTFAARGPQ